MLVDLTHAGYTEDCEITEAMPELDFIIEGHSHTRIDSTCIVNSILISQTQSKR